MWMRPIRTDDDYRQALAAVDAIWAEAQPGTEAGDRLDVLVTLIQAYEREHHPIPPPDPIEAIKFRVEQMGISRKALEGILGTRAIVTEVLARKRSLSISMIRKLHAMLDIPAEILIRATPRAPEGRRTEVTGKMPSRGSGIKERAGAIKHAGASRSEPSHRAGERSPGNLSALANPKEEHAEAVSAASATGKRRR